MKIDHSYRLTFDQRNGLKNSVTQLSEQNFIGQTGSGIIRSKWSNFNRRQQQVNTKAWRQALQRADIKDFRWHDLRHTWASWHVQAGTPLHVLQELGGWESVEMVRRYAHLSSEHLAGYVDKLSTFRTAESGLIATI